MAAASSAGSPEIRRFVSSAAAGLQCMVWLPVHDCFVDAQLRLGADSLELRVLGAGMAPTAVHLGYLRSARVASKAEQADQPTGLSESWADFAVLLEFFEPTEAMELRRECVLLSGDVEAQLLCQSLQQLQRFGVAPERKEPPEWVTAQARRAFAALADPDVAQALRNWREGSAWQPQRARVASAGLSLASVWQDATQAVWDAITSPAVLGLKPDPSWAAGGASDA
ncbi:unnamed protein product [Effrenium voratum]|nr:unnamed protein product [Effrenium voratum]